MEGQSITLKIAGKEYPLKARNPEAEQLMRLAAEDITIPSSGDLYVGYAVTDLGAGAYFSKNIE